MAPAHPLSEGTQQLQPATSGAVPEEWLLPFADTLEARRLAQLEADRDLLNQIMWAGYAGPTWEELKERLIAYGYQALLAWLRRGTIFAKCEAAQGYLLKPTLKSREPDEARSLAGETVTTAIVMFRETVLIPGVWRPDRGASLDTFFTGQCLIRFPNIYRRWLKENGWGGADALDDVDKRRGESLDVLTPIPDPRPYASPDASIAILSHLEAIDDPKTREIAGYIAEGYSHLEIAKLAGVSVSAIKSRLYRLRTNTKAQLIPREAHGIA